MKRTATHLTLALLILALLAGCGFQLRKAPDSLDGLPQPLLISGAAPYSGLGGELRRQLRATGVSLTTEPAQAAATLRISQYRSASRLLSLDARNRAAESELEESLHFDLRGRDGHELLPERTLRELRTLLSNADQVLARQHEEDRVREEMRRQLVRRLLRRLAALN